ncbi:MAG: hypothetical protein L6Q95_17225, partial [Planctomycetes bacterium]|nr:hypothetical protein [Planctomycetota bacterium]
VLLHGDAPLGARSLVAAGLGRLLTTGDPPPLGARDPSFRLERVRPGAAADVVLDLGDGTAWRQAGGTRMWGGTLGGRVVLGVEPREGGDPSGAARAILETLAAGEALRALLGLPARTYDFA